MQKYICGIFFGKCFSNPHTTEANPMTKAEVVAFVVIKIGPRMVGEALYPDCFVNRFLLVNDIRVTKRPSPISQVLERCNKIYIKNILMYVPYVPIRNIGKKLYLSTQITLGQ